MSPWLAYLGASLSRLGSDKVTTPSRIQPVLPLKDRFLVAFADQFTAAAAAGSASNAVFLIEP